MLVLHNDLIHITGDFCTDCVPELGNAIRLYLNCTFTAHLKCQIILVTLISPLALKFQF